VQFEDLFMRRAFAASALCLSFFLAAPPAAPQAPASSVTPSAAQVANDAAAKHAKRTACLKDAKTRKLVGADKTAFLKGCMDAPLDAISASRVSQSPL
jgi:CubicO group peptidase (beta-lactamase class C family)